MDTRTFARKSIRRPSFDLEELPLSDVALAGRFDHDESRAENAEQDGVKGTGSLHHVVLERSSFANTVLTDLELMDVSCDTVALPNASWSGVTARRVEFIMCQMVGFQLALSKAEDVYFEDCKLDYARIEVEQNRGTVVYHRCSFSEAILVGDLSDTVFSECEFVGTEFQAHGAAGCDMTTSRFAETSGLLTLHGARITEDQSVTLAAMLASEAGFILSSAADSSGGN